MWGAACQPGQAARATRRGGFVCVRSLRESRRGNGGEKRWRAYLGATGIEMGSGQVKQPSSQAVLMTPLPEGQGRQ